MSTNIDFISDEEWKLFTSEMIIVAKLNHFRANVPADPNDTVQSAFASFFRRREAGEKRELEANTPEAVRLALLFRVWRKRKEHQRRASYVTNSANKFNDIDPTGQLESSISRDVNDEAETEFFIKEVLEQIEHLPEPDREIVKLCMLGNTNRQIAETMKVPLAVVSGTLLAIKIRFLKRDHGEGPIK